MVGQMISVRPSDILFTQNSVAEHFGERSDGESIEETFTQLLYGEKKVDEIQCIAIVDYEEEYWVLYGNRRLYVYRKLEKYGRITTVRVKLLPIESINMDKFLKKMTTKNNGTDITIRQGRGNSWKDSMSSRLGNIYSQWVREGRPTNGRPTAHAAGNYQDDDEYESYNTPVSPVQWPSYTPPTRPTPTPNYMHALRTPVTPVVPQPQPHTVYEVYEPPPQRPKKDDSWCTIL